MKLINGLYQIQGVSYPRSGRGLLTHVVREYFGNSRLVQHPKPKGYGGIDERLNWAKNHDFNHGFPIRADVKYVIQFRSPVRAIVSNFMLNHKDRPRHFPNFAKSAMGVAHWKHIFNKWVKWAASNTANAFILKYEDLILNSEEILYEFFIFMSEEEINKDKLKEAIQLNNILPKDSLRVKSPRIYSECKSCFNWIEEKLKDQMKEYDLPSYEDGV